MPQKLTTNEYVAKAIDKHGTNYDYTKVDYTVGKGKVAIICNSCGTEFQQRADSHLLGSGCKCLTKKTKEKWSTHTFIAKSKELFGAQFDYSMTVFEHVHTKVTLRCNICDHSFEQQPSNHLRGAGCSNCRRISKITTTTEFSTRASEVHLDKYTYNLKSFTQQRSKIEIYCKKCKHTFEQTASSHLRGSGCPSCADYGFNPSKSAILYYLSINDGEAYKIGITNHSVKKRYTSTDLTKITVLKEWDYPIGEDAYVKEQLILKTHSLFKYTGEPLLSSGNTELFVEDVLGLDS